MSKKIMNKWTTYSLLGVFSIMIFGFLGFIYVYQKDEQNRVIYEQSQQIKEKIEPVLAEGSQTNLTDLNSWESIYPNTKPMKIGNIDLLASVASSWPDRIKGLSDTPYLPENVAKVFVFDSVGFHSFWMKDMNYSIDIIWVSEEGKIVYIQEKAAPESYPGMFVPETPAKYVIETISGFVEVNDISLGDLVVLPKY